MTEPYRKPAPTSEQLLAAAHALGHPVPPPADEHPTIAEMMAREAADLVRGYSDGDINHVLQPVIGWLRYTISKGELPDVNDLIGYADRMWEACEAENAFLAERKAAALAADGAPQLAMITPVGSRPHPVHDSVTGFVWNLLRRASEREPTETDVAPTGWLYMPTGARNLDAVFKAMWSSPEADALRTVPHGAGEFSEPNLTIQEQAQLVFDRMWAEFLGLPTSNEKD